MSHGKSLIVLALLACAGTASAGSCEHANDNANINAFTNPSCDGPAHAPEIDPGSAISGLSLLLGGVAVIRGRRRKP